MLKLGYSFWGFLSGDIIDTSDGGRFWRPFFIREMLNRNWEVIYLQERRDPKEFIFDKKKKDYFYPVYSSKFPEIDVLFLEWRWPIQGKNTKADKFKKEYTPDLERQNELLQFYTKDRKVKTLIWDRDRTLTKKDEEELAEFNVIFLDMAFVTRYNHEQLFSPMDFKELLKIKPKGEFNHQYLLGFIGNNYQKDKEIKKYINPVAELFFEKIHFWGDWAKYPKLWPSVKRKFPHIVFHDRISWNKATELYQELGSIIFLAREEYSNYGQISSKVFEAIYYKCPLFIPAEFHNYELLVPPRNIITDKYDLIYQLMCLRKMTSKQRIKFIENQTEKFLSLKNLFSSEAVINKLEMLIKKKGGGRRKNFHREE